LKINCKRESVEMLLRLILKTRSTDQRHETGRLKHTRTEKNVITVDEMVGLLNHEGQNKHIVQYARYPKNGFNKV